MNKSLVNHDIIKVLDFASKHSQGFTLDEVLQARIVEEFFIDELVDSLCAKCKDMFEEEQTESRNKIFHNLFAVKNEKIYSETMSEMEFMKEMKFILNTEGYFKILQYREIEDARKNAKWAQWTAIVAIFISIAFGVIQICLN